ncbi:tetracycline efflux protein [Lichtheimia corymbifera JMRC:FSU:9682]|uniref:Tetracycline efflux protein n=1 Tax=Lichtheimia corymbifera JMRC:FSU:9682 TaxID=1263082 RepID=A0A068S8L5_9FUNG|nr:tetracycline efflux protein [Lichtheimia corymbifera JMRC:FSU:9682]
MYIIVADIVPLDKRASYEGLIQACFTFATVCGPFVGGTLTDHVSWRGIFFVIIPLGLIGMIIIGLFLHLPVEEQDLRNKLKRIDYAGILMVMGATVLFMLAMSFISQGYPWESPLIVAPMVTATVLVALLIYVETKVAIEPLLPPRLFTNVPVLCFNIYNLSWGIAYTAFMYYVPTYFQVVHGDSSMMSGVRLIPLDVCSMIVAFAVGWYITLKGGYRLPLSGGMALYVICFGLFFLFDANTSWAEIQGIMVIGGVGTGGIVGSSAIALQAAVEERDIAVASGLLAYTFMLGGGLGAALAFALINLYLQNNLPRMIPPEYAERIFDYPGFIRDGLPSQYFDAAIEVYNDAYKRLWYLMVIFSGIAFVSSLFIKQFSLIRVDSDDTIHEEVNDRQSLNVSEPNKNPNRSPTSISGQYQSLATDQQLLRSY